MITDLTLKDKKLKKIFCDRFKIESKFWNEDNAKAHLLSSTIGLAPRDLIYLLFDVEKEFDIKIEDKYIVSGEFCSFNNIKNIILEQLNTEEN
ncbi:peptide maturation system acyl carrier-related protein [Clostridium cibarium]|uniref:Peptide maturation system acyl carrier-related protein n=1 Tax=Clostridium cibarium TaxID=2762247 RepID=A0ABR8PWS1_9CLOT|nr:peptide maturation system acyl carrier-related protein [Clostridium cibarium]MBD7912579.1 peptide maturation system acyl carrier-related protein [Clostridium cibarium]